MKTKEILNYLLQYKIHVHVKNNAIHASINNKNMRVKAIVSLDKSITLKFQLPDHIFNQILTLISSQVKKITLNSKPI